MGASGMMGSFFRYIADTIRRPRAELTRRQRQLRYAGELVAHCWRVLVRHRAEGMAAELTYRTIFSLIPLVVLGLVTFRVFGGLDDIEDRVAEQMYSFFGVPDIPDEAYGPSLEIDQDAAPAEFEPRAGEGDGDDQDGTPDEDSDSDNTDTQPNASEPDASSASDGTSQSPQETQSPEETASGELAGTSASGDGQSDASQAPESDEDAKRRVQASIRFALRELTDKVSTIDFASIGVIGLILFIYAAIALLDSVRECL